MKRFTLLIFTAVLFILLFIQFSSAETIEYLVQGVDRIYGQMLSDRPTTSEVDLAANLNLILTELQDRGSFDRVIPTIDDILGTLSYGAPLRARNFPTITSVLLKHSIKNINDLERGLNEKTKLESLLTAISEDNFVYPGFNTIIESASTDNLNRISAGVLNKVKIYFSKILLDEVGSATVYINIQRQFGDPDASTFTWKGDPIYSTKPLAKLGLSGFGRFAAFPAQIEYILEPARIMIEHPDLFPTAKIIGILGLGGEADARLIISEASEQSNFNNDDIRTASRKALIEIGRLRPILDFPYALEITSPVIREIATNRGCSAVDDLSAELNNENSFFSKIELTLMLGVTGCPAAFDNINAYLQHVLTTDPIMVPEVAGDLRILWLTTKDTQTKFRIASALIDTYKKADIGWVVAQVEDALFLSNVFKIALEEIPKTGTPEQKRADPIDDIGLILYKLEEIFPKISPDIIEVTVGGLQELIPLVENLNTNIQFKGSTVIRLSTIIVNGLSAQLKSNPQKYSDITQKLLTSLSSSSSVVYTRK